MVVAMMLPASLPAIHAVEAATAVRCLAGAAPARRSSARSLLVWTAFGLVAFFGDVVLHHVVDATPWLADGRGSSKPAILALAGG